MALFVVISGALLLIGGAVSLLMGFDIVMTERGAAMAIGGTVALSGGLVSVGIGGVLLRLSQILRALEQRQPKAKSAVPDRPVVPLKQPEESEPVPPAASVVSPMVAAGVATAAAGATAVALSRETSAFEASASGVLDETPLQSPNDILRTLKAEMTSEAVVVEKTSPDLEDELARALAELDEPPSVRPPVDDSADQPSGKAGRRRRPWSSRKDADPTADILAVNETALQEAMPEEPVAADVEEIQPEPEVEAVALGESEVMADQPMPQEEADPALLPAKPKVLGTYNVGGRAYSMYADGSVEAVTELGVERFASMEDLRKHLAKT